MSARRNWNPKRVTLSGGGGPGRITREDAEKRDREFDAPTQLKQLLYDRPDALVLLEAILAEKQGLTERVNQLILLERARRSERDDLREDLGALEEEFNTYRELAEGERHGLEDQLEVLDGELHVVEEENRTLREENTMVRMQLSREQPNVDALARLASSMHK
jgi:chromosome segregation ATPase